MSAVARLIARLRPTGDSMVAQFHDLAARARAETACDDGRIAALDAMEREQRA